MAIFDEPRVRQALVRVRGKGTTGTGFFIDEDLVMTCHHVVDGADAIAIEDASGQTSAATVVEEMTVPDIDIAVLRVASRAPVVLPLGATPAQPEEVWISGFQLQSAHLRGPLPTAPTVAGSTEIDYHHRRQYTLRNILRLAGGTISGGISGAPVVVMPEAVAIAVTTADFDKGGGFAVPVQQALERSVALREHARSLDARIPAYGRYLNLAAARELCAMQVDGALAHMSDRGQFLPNKYVERHRLSNALSEFRQSDAQIFPVVGISGIGKTNTLAAIAQTTPPAIFLAAHRAKFDDRGLAATLAADLSKHAPLPVNPERLVDALSETRLLVILDGLNEAQALAQAAGRAWLEDTFDWLKKRAVQLVVTSRVEFWSLIADLFPTQLLFVVEDDQGKRNRAQASTFVLQPFDDDELHHAADAYGLSADAAEHTALRHPLLIRLYWELGARGERVGMYALFERFVEERSLRVSRTLGGTASPKTVQHALAIATRLADPKTLTIPTNRLIEQLTAFNDVRETLVSENLLVESADGYRFLFDELADFLIAHERQLPRGVKAWKEVLSGEETRASWVRFALLRLERTAPDQLTDALQEMIGAFDINPDWYSAALIKQTISALEKPQRVRAVVVKLAQSVAQALMLPDHIGLAELAWQVELTVAERLNAARLFLPHEHYYDWEEKRWRDVPSDSFFAHLDGESAPGIVADALRVDPHEALRILMEWLDDASPLSDGERSPDSTAEIKHIARAFVFHSRHRDLAFVCSQIAERPTQGARDLLRLIAVKDGEQLLPYIEEWASRRTENLDMLAIETLTRVDWPDSSEWIALAETIAERILASSGNPQASTLALSILISRPRFAARMFGETLSRVMSDHPFTRADMLRPYLSTRFDVIIDAFRRYLDDEHPDRRKTEVIQSLQRAPVTTQHMEKVAEFLSGVLVKHPEFAADIAGVVETALYNAEAPSAANDAFFALAKRLLVTGDELTRRLVLYGVCISGKPAAKTAAQEALINDLCAGDYPSELLMMLLRELAHGRYRSDADMERIHTLAARLEEKPDGTLLIRLASARDDFASRLAEWLPERSVCAGSMSEEFIHKIRAEQLKPRKVAQALLIAKRH